MQNVPLTVGSIVRHGLTRHRDASVITAGDCPSRVRFGDLLPRVGKLANALVELGITRQQRVATLMWNNHEHFEAYAAVPSIGAVLHTLNARLSSEELAYIVNHAEDQIIIVDESLSGVMAEILPLLKSVQTVLVAQGGNPQGMAAQGKQVLRLSDVLEASSSEAPWPHISEQDAAVMCYTSGTTGRPKGVVYSHRSTYLHSMSVCTGNALAMSSQDRLLALVPMFHANAWGWPYASLMSGADLVLPDRHLEPENVVRLIEEERITLTGGVPTLWNDVLEYIRATGPYDLSSLRLILCGGSAAPGAMIEAYREELGINVLHAWGMTEMSPLGSLARPPKLIADPDNLSNYSESQGRLLFGVDARIVADDGALLPQDGRAMGEIEVSGPWVAGSYYRDEEPESFDNGWLRTGDVGTIDELGYLRLTDRSKDVIKSGGEWISSVDLENRLAGHPQVVEAAVIGVPDARWGERPMVMVVLRKDATADVTQLQLWLSNQIPKWSLPERWVVLDSIPRTSVGKFDKRALRKAFADGKMTPEHLEAHAIDEGSGFSISNDLGSSQIGK